MFRRRSRPDAGEAGSDDVAAEDLAADDAAASDAAAGDGRSPGGQPSGPWDSEAAFPERARHDFGCMLVPKQPGLDVHINVADEHSAWIDVLRGQSGLRLQAFAAPKTGGLWDEVRQEITAEVARAGGGCQEAVGPFGAELHALVAPADDPHGRQRQFRFIGVDGPRWFLRGMISGPAAARPELAAIFEGVFADIVVVRGDHPAPPRNQLVIQLPEHAQHELEEQLARESRLPNPFERGPEITEIR